jgi:hypothetical protein
LQKIPAIITLLKSNNFFFHKRSRRYIDNVKKTIKKKEKQKLPLLGFEPIPLSFNAVDK